MATGRPSSFLDPNVVVVDTKVVAEKGRPDAISHYQIVTAADHEPNSHPRTYITTDQEAYEMALFAEGREDRFNIEWHHGWAPDGNRCQLLDDLQPAAIEELA